MATNGTGGGTNKASEASLSYVKAIEDPPPEQYCALCLRKGKLLCSICKLRRYCSKECQRMDWKGHKLFCENAPSKEQVEEDDLCAAGQPKYNSPPMDASPNIPTPRFPVGTSVICHMGRTEWVEGVVQRNWYHEMEDDDWPNGTYVPYQVRLINGRYIFAPEDSKEVIRRNTRDDWIEIHHINSLCPSYVKAIEDPPPEQYCARCLRKGKIFCTVCQARCYCSEKCRRKDWEGHKDYCLAAPSKEEVEEKEKNSSKIPKYCSRPIDAPDRIPDPRFSVGTSVICKVTKFCWSEGVVQCQWYKTTDESGQGKYVPYEIRLLNGMYVTAPVDSNDIVQRNTRDNWIEIHHINSLLPSYVKANEDPPPERYCTRCLGKGKLLCSTCQARPYCSLDCQKRDWNRHKHCCEEAPSKEKVEDNDSYYSDRRKNTSRPMDALLGVPTTCPQIPVGTSVICKVTSTEWIEGVVQCHWYCNSDRAKGVYFPYQIRLINGKYIFSQHDHKDVIRVNNRDNWIKVHHRFESMKEAQQEAKRGQVDSEYCIDCSISRCDALLRMVSA